jgi:hypothetical protein
MDFLKPRFQEQTAPAVLYVSQIIIPGQGLAPWRDSRKLRKIQLMFD